jgi:transposase-like protein
LVSRGYSPQIASPNPPVASSEVVPNNNLIEQDHRSVKQRLAVMLGFKQFRNAAITIAGIELLHRIRKGQFGLRRVGVQGRVAPAVWNAVLKD